MGPAGVGRSPWEVGPTPRRPWRDPALMHRGPAVASWVSPTRGATVRFGAVESLQAEAVDSRELDILHVRASWTKVGPRAAVSDPIVREWTDDVLALGPRPAIISLLGKKPDGTSEYSFYSFHGGFEDEAGSLSFAEWLAQVDDNVLLIEHPTVDFSPPTAETLAAIGSDVVTLLAEGRTVLVFDSGGQTRTAHVCKHLGAKEAFPTIESR